MHSRRIQFGKLSCDQNSDEDHDALAEVIALLHPILHVPSNEHPRACRHSNTEEPYFDRIGLLKRRDCEIRDGDAACLGAEHGQQTATVGHDSDGPFHHVLGFVGDLPKNEHQRQDGADDQHSHQGVGDDRHYHRALTCFWPTAALFLPQAIHLCEMIAPAGALEFRLLVLSRHYSDVCRSRTGEPTRSTRMVSSDAQRAHLSGGVRPGVTPPPTHSRDLVVRLHCGCHLLQLRERGGSRSGELEPCARIRTIPPQDLPSSRRPRRQERAATLSDLTRVSWRLELYVCVKSTPNATRPNGRAAT